MLRAALTTIALGTTALAAAAAGPAVHRVENHVAGYTVVLPAGWHAAVLRDDGSMTIATYRVRATGNVSVRVPAGQTWIRLYDEGPLSALPGGAARIGVLPRRLPPVEPYEGFGPSRRLEFRAGGHSFLAFVKGRASVDVLPTLATIQVTARGQALANIHSVRVLGRSVEGRPIRVWRIGNPRSHRHVLVVGCIHGDECAGMAITVRLLNLIRPTTADLWVIQDLNPDGLHAGTRQNARGVDLNRNFGAMWQPLGQPGSRQYSGPRPFSEPESRAVRALILRLHPQITIWFHQPQGVVRAWGPSVPAARRFARLAGAPYRSLPWPAGTAPNWQNHLGLTSFVVELPPGPLATISADRYARAILSLAEE